MKRKILSILLCFALVIAAVLPMGTVFAQGTAPETLQATDEDKNGLFLGKTAEEIGENQYKISLEAYTSGEVKTEVKDVPLDIVLVLDQSGSMSDSFGNTNRQAAMKTAVQNFIDSVGQKYSADADHRLALVEFRSSATILEEWTFADANGVENLKQTVGNLSENGATNVGAGMQRAEELMTTKYNYTGKNTSRQKVVIVFTDGVPTKSSDFDIGVANTAISHAKTLKDNGVSVYSVGIFYNAEPSQLHGDTYHYFDWGTQTTECTGEVGSVWNSNLTTALGDVSDQDIPAGNRFLNYISNNFLSATEIGIKNKNDTIIGIGYYGYQITQNFERDSSDYYLTASNSDELNNVFQTISDSISQPSISLDASTVIKDTVTPYFDVPENTSNIRIYTADATASNGTSWGAKEPAQNVVATITGNSISVTGFDFNQYFVSENPKPGTTSDYGKKLIIEFTVTRKENFIGGNNVPTNGTDSGVYTEKGLVENFDVPVVDVPIRYDYTTSNQTIFLGETADLTTRVQSPSYVDGTNNAYVDISYVVKNGDQTVGIYTILAGNSSGSWTWTPDGAQTPALTEDTTYTVDCTVTPTQKGSVSAYDLQKTFTVYVQSGTLTIQKQGGQAGEKYVFNIQKDGEFYMTVTVNGNESTTIQKLPKGSYIVTEETAWSWRYQDQTYQNNTFGIDAENPKQTVTCINENRNSQWLNGYADAANEYVKGGA